MEIQTIAIGIVFVIIFLIIKHPRVGTNEPPLVPFTIPILGHTYQYIFNSKNFIQKCKEQYGECFSIYVFGSVVTIVTRRYVNEVFTCQDDFDIILAAKEAIPLHKLLTYNDGLNSETNIFHARTVRGQISGKLNFILPTLQKFLAKGVDKSIGDCDDPKIFYNTWFLLNNIITLPVANILVGEEAASHEDLVKSFANFTFDLSPLVKIPPIFSFIHKKLHEFMISLPMRFGWNPVNYHRQVTMNRIKPVIEKRLKEKIELGDKYKPYNDVLEHYMNQPNFDYSKPDNIQYHIDNFFVLVFTSISATSRAVTNALVDLAGRPECLNELYEEALSINKEYGSLTVSDVKKMKKLNSFVKESLRNDGVVAGLDHYMTSKSFTFSNGFTIPEGRLTRICIDDLLKSKENYGDDAEEFKPFRFVSEEDSSATRVNRSYIIFGGGKRACPGRFFAVHEIKLLLHYLILKYNISTESGKIENKIAMGPHTIPSRSGIVFKNRK